MSKSWFERSGSPTAYDAGSVGRAASRLEDGVATRTVMVVQSGEALGDAIIRIPAYRALRAAFPQHRIVGVYELSTVFLSTLAAVRDLFLDEIIVGQRQQSLFHVGAIARDLGNVDLVLDFRPNGKVVGSYLSCFGATPCYLANTPGFALRKRVAGFHERRPESNVRRFHRMVELATRQTLPFDAHLPEDPCASAHAAALLPAGPRYLGIAPGPSGSRKYWPRPQHEALALHVREMGLCPVYLLGPDPSETAQREWLEQCAPDAVFVDLGEAGGDKAYLAWLFHAVAPRLTACVAVEGGIGHLVATQQTALLTLEGPTNAMRWRPVTPTWRLVRATDFGSNTMDTIPVASVAAVIAEMVEKTSSRQGAE